LNLEIADVVILNLDYGIKCLWLSLFVGAQQQLTYVKGTLKNIVIDLHAENAHAICLVCGSSTVDVHGNVPFESMSVLHLAVH